MPTDGLAERGIGASDGSLLGQSSTEAIEFQLIFSSFSRAELLEKGKERIGTSKRFWLDFYITHIMSINDPYFLTAT